MNAVQGLDVLALLPLQRAESTVRAQVHMVPPKVVTHLQWIRQRVRAEKETENLPKEEVEELSYS